MDILETDSTGNQKKLHQYCFKLVMMKQSWTLSVESDEERKKWMKELSDARKVGTEKRKSV